MINRALFQPLNMVYIGAVLLGMLYFYDWARAHVKGSDVGVSAAAPGT